MAASAAAPAVREVNQAIWRTIAGAGFRLPPLNSAVFYFPQGHLEQCSGADIKDSIENFPINRPFILCRVMSIQLLSHPIDEVFSRFILKPITRSEAAGAVAGVSGDGGYQADDIHAIVKELTQSDANCGGGFSVPKSVAMAILPPLDFEKDPPLQRVSITDVHGTEWKFRHIYRGWPRRHLFTTGWGQFVNAKHLIAGDSVVFMKKVSTGQVFAGIRRSRKNCINRREEVLTAVRMAAMGMEFQVDCYPKAESPAFVVSAEKVVEASRTHWKAGMRIQIALETETVSKLDQFHGTVQAVELPQTGPWRGSPWRMLRVRWDDLKKDVLKVPKIMNPWDIQYINVPPLLEYYALSSIPAEMPGPSYIRSMNLLNTPFDNNNQLLFIQLLNDALGFEQRTHSPIGTSSNSPSTVLSHQSPNNSMVEQCQGQSHLVEYDAFTLFGVSISIPKQLRTDDSQQ